MPRVIFKDLTARNLSYRLVGVLCLIIGVVSAWLWNSFNKTEPTYFAVQLQPKPETIFQERDLSEYDYGGVNGECTNYVNESPCNESLEPARKFLLDHWREKKRAYAVVQFNCMDCSAVYHIFVEPDKAGRWGVVIRRDNSGWDRGFSRNIQDSRAYTILNRRASAADRPFKRGQSYLIFLNIKGEEILRF